MEEELLDELLDELFEELLDELELLEEELDELLEPVPPEHTPPVTLGSSTVPLVVPWKPNSTLWPGAIVPFHPRLLAVYGLLPL